jgi:Fe2+ or Zn2+ uptake regulation protein
MWGGAPEQGVVSSYQVAHLLDNMAAAARSTRVDVTLGTTELVMSLLQEAGDPVSRNWLLERLKESGHTTSRARLNRALKFCFDLGLAVEGSKGVQWTHTTSPGLLRTLAKGKRV